jgi:glycosyltransferase involved in cell wall biosynthesis
MEPQRHMRIAQVAPLFESVPPAGYGGTERIVSYLTEELVRRGHSVTLFASGDSVTGARLITCVERGLRSHGRSDATVQRAIAIQLVRQHLDDFDLLHFHDGVFHLPTVGDFGRPHLTTLHDRLDMPDIERLLALSPSCALVSISKSQKAPVPYANWLGTVQHGIPAPAYADVVVDNYLAFVGRLTPEKGLEYAIEIARRASLPLKVAAKTDAEQYEGYSRRLASLLRSPGVEFIGEVGQIEKMRLIAHSRGLLFPVTWPEPLGLVLIEAMACGTPVVAFRRGAVPEVVVDGVTGFMVDSVDHAVAAVRLLDRFDRARCRRSYEQRFTVERMVDDYLALYARLVAKSAKSTEPTAAP